MLDVRTAPNLDVGYVMGSGDEVAPFIEQLGARVEMLGPDALAWGDLSRYNTIVLGVRAYETPGRSSRQQQPAARVRAERRDGDRPVQPRDDSTTRTARIPRKSATIASPTSTRPCEILEPAHPVFTTPNRLTDAAWSGWVQERGLNFLGEKDSRYRDLVQLTDSFPNNPGPKRGALVEAAYGKGRWIYVALGLWRELPAGVDGAYPILANLISLGQPPPPPPGAGAGKATGRTGSKRPAAPARPPVKAPAPTTPAPAAPARPPAKAPAPTTPAAPAPAR